MGWVLIVSFKSIPLMILLSLFRSNIYLFSVEIWLFLILIYYSWRFICNFRYLLLIQ